MKIAQEFGLNAIEKMRKLGLNEDDIKKIMSDSPEYVTFEKLTLKQQLEAILKSENFKKYLIDAVRETKYDEEYFINLLFPKNELL